MYRINFTRSTDDLGLYRLLRGIKKSRKALLERNEHLSYLMLYQIKHMLYFEILSQLNEKTLRFGRNIYLFPKKCDLWLVRRSVLN